MDFPEDFRCPISMELMKDPVAIPTGITYDRKNIESWFHTYKKRTCPTTMQPLETLEATPNLTLKRLIDAWRAMHDQRKPSLAKILESVNTTPFKTSPLRKLREAVGTADDEAMREFKGTGGVIESLVSIIIQIGYVENYDFSTLRACEEALGVLDRLVPLISEDGGEDGWIMARLMRPDCMRSMTMVLRRGGSEARYHAISIFRRMSRADHQWNSCVVAQDDRGVDFFKSLLETVSDEVCSKTSSSAVQLLLQVLETSKKSRLKAIEAGAICSLVELLPESNGTRCDKILMMIKLMCECADGRLAFTEHGLGIAAVSRKMVSVSSGATRICVKIMWLISSFHPKDKVLEEMLLCGAVERIVSLIQVDGGDNSLKDRMTRILKLHGGAWRRYPCFPAELKIYVV